MLNRLTQFAIIGMKARDLSPPITVSSFIVAVDPTFILRIRAPRSSGEGNAAGDFLGSRLRDITNKSLRASCLSLRQNFRGESRITAAAVASERAGGCTLSILAYQTSCFCFRGDNSPTRYLGLARLKSPTWKVHQHNLRKLPDSGMPERISGKVVRILAKATLRTRVIHSYRSRMLEVRKV